MKRIIYDVPRWHLLLHREARDLASATESDIPPQQFEDELFDRLYSGAVDLLPEEERDSALRQWAEKVHAVCEQLPAFARLAQECKGRPAAAATAVEALMGELDSLTESPDAPSQQQRARRRVVAGCERASRRHRRAHGDHGRPWPGPLPERPGNGDWARGRPPG